MCVSALIVLGEKIRNNIDEQTQEQWLLAYIGEYCDLNIVKWLQSLIQVNNSHDEAGCFRCGSRSISLVTAW